MQRLILASSNPGDLVLDPFSGVGTCPVVCKRLGRRFIAFEGNVNFVKKANERLSALESGQQSLDLASGA